MKVEKMTKKQIISEILHCDSRFSKYLYTLQDLKKSILIDVYFFVLILHISSFVCDNFEEFLWKILKKKN